MNEPEYDTILELINAALAVASMTEIRTVTIKETTTPMIGMVRGFNGDEQRQVTMTQDAEDLYGDWEIATIEEKWNDDTQP